MTKDEALDLALEVLEYIDREDNDRDFLFPFQCAMLDKAITAIKQALAAPVQEPVAQAWDEGYRAGIDDERTSEDSIGIAGFDAKVEPARNNPYRTTPSAAQPAPPECQTEAEKTAFSFGWWKALESVRQPAVPDAFGTREGEHPQYVQGWNDCRAEMLGGVKP
jgi:hypothetical protein